MALINIDYGSLASSETMNKNFLYLDEKIADTAENVSTSISSILSNIATLNTRISDVSDEIKDATENFSDDLKESQTKMQMKVNNCSMVPDWSSCISIATPSNYVAPSNGYLMICPTTTSSGSLTVNGVNVFFKTVSSGNDYAAILIPFPVKEGDVITCYCSLIVAYFLPAFREIEEN